MVNLKREQRLKKIILKIKIIGSPFWILERERGYIFKLKFQFISKYKIKTIKKQILGKTQLQTKTLSF